MGWSSSSPSWAQFDAAPSAAPTPALTTLTPVEMTSRVPRAPDGLYQHYVAVALLATGLMLVAVPVTAALARLAVSWALVWTVFGIVAAASIAAATLLRGRFARGSAGLVVLYAWSLLDVGAVGAVVATSGGERSWFWVAFVLTTIFFSVGYPLPGQLALLAATLLTFVVTCLVGTPSIAVASLVWKAAVLVAVFGLSSFPASELRRQTAEHRLARQEADELTSALMRRELWWRSLIERTSDPIVVFDASWHFAFASPAFESLLGYSSEEVAGLELGSIVDPRDLEGVRAAAANLRPGVPSRATCRVRAASGTWHDIELSFTEVGEAPGPEVVVNLHDVTDRVAAEAALLHQATHDPLTGLANRAAFNEALRSCLAIAARARRPVAVVTLDLEAFKIVNDTLGHAGGDAVLTEVGRRLETTLRGADMVARLGGDEFGAVLAVGGDPEGGLVAARRVLRALDEPVLWDGRPYWLRASAGVACDVGDGLAPDELLRQAARAMFEAKRTGIDVVLYDPRMEGRDAARFALLGELRHAISEGELRLVFQPKVAPARGDVVGVEALVRWAHPQRGLLAPAAFLPVAEDSGLVHAITGWVLPTALRQLAAWRAGGWDLSVSVNLSAQDLADDQLPGRVEGWLREAGVEPHRLVLELTEASAIADQETGSGMLARFRAMGIRVSLDDFGTGYSSLAYLAQLPIDEIKLDRGFVTSGLGTGAFLVRSVVDIGHHLGLSVVAEGVETDAVLAQVVGSGCDCVQGYVYAKPMAPEEMAAFFERWRTRPVLMAPAAEDPGCGRASTATRVAGILSADVRNLEGEPAGMDDGRGPGEGEG